MARCPEDGIIEALEGTSSDHFVLAVQWHPERSVDDDVPSRAIFRALIEAALLTRRRSRVLRSYFLAGLPARYSAGNGLSGRSSSQIFDAIHQRLPS